MILRDFTGIRRFGLLLAMMFVAIVAGAVPAKPGLTRTLKLTDGTTITARLIGDENGHFWLGQDGKTYNINESDVAQIVDTDAIKSRASMRRQQSNVRRMRRMAPRKVGEVGSITGQKKGLIILVNFSDVTFKSSNNNALYKRIANEKNFSSGNFKGSMYDYFYAQSEGQFQLTFDVVGPVAVSEKQSYYGKNDSQGNDVHPAEMVIEALKLVDSQVNFKDYDWDGDGEVDQVYVVYAGKGEADGGATTTIWPHEWTLSEAVDYGDGSGVQTFDGVKIDTYACGGELNGQTGSIAGIGTMCHEFSHCLGYPDFYDTDYSGGQGMFSWDLMDNGSYNGDGYLPAGFTSYERWVAGWKTPIELTSTCQISNLKSLQDGGDSYIIYNKGNKNEYFLLENRQQTKWDGGIPGEGLLILHVDYDSQVWASNQPNDTPSHQRMTWVAADNKYQYTTYNGTKYFTEEGAANDPFPYGGVNAFSKSTTPAAKFYNKNSDGTYYMDSSVESIVQNSDGTVSFKFNADDGTSVTPVTPSTDTNAFRLVSSVDELESGKRYIIACGSKNTAAGTLSNSVLGSEDVTVGNDVVNAGEAVSVFILEKTSNGWSFKNESSNQYLYATNTKKLSYSSTQNAWTLSDGATGVIMTYGDYGTMLYNVNSPRFTTYTSSPSSSMIQANLYIENGSETPTTSDPVIVAEESLTFSTTVGTPQTKTFKVLTENLTENVTLTLDDPNNVFSLGQSTISKTVTEASVSVTFTPAQAGTFTGTITLTSTGADPVTVSLSATATESTTQDDPNESVSKKFRLLTSIDEFVSGKRYIIACGSKNVAAGEYNGSSYLVDAEVTVEDDVITIGDDVSVFILEGDKDKGCTVKFESSGKYLHATAVKKLATDGNATSLWTLRNGTAGVTLTFSSCGTILYNANSPRFTTYTSNPNVSMIQANLYVEITEEKLAGDISGDGVVDNSDVDILINILLGNADSSDAADVNGDGTVDIADVTTLVNMILGK